MPIVIILAAAGVLYLLQLLLYQRTWDKGLQGSVDLGEDRFIFEGDTIETEETLVNDKLLPLPWVYLKFQLAGNGEPRIARSDMFSLSNRVRIRRKRRFQLKERGVYTLSEISLVSHDLFLTRTFSRVIRTGLHQSVTVYPRLLEEDEWPVSRHQLTGDVVTRRLTLEDPYLFKGIRDYQPEDSLRNINFKASAKTGEWKVNVHEYTVSEKVCILLGMDKAARYFDPVLYEQALRIAGTLANAFEKEGVPVSLYSNGKDSLHETDTRVEAGCGTEHIYDILGALARMNTEKEVGSIVDFLRDAAQNPERDTQYILVTPAYRLGVKEAFEELAEGQPNSRWFMPVTLSQSRDSYFEPNEYKENLPGFSFWVV